MKQSVLLALVLFVALGCGHSLKEVADKVPVTIKCPAPDLAAASELVSRFTSDPDQVRKELTERATKDPLGVTCLLLDVQSHLLETGQRFSKAYEETAAGLEALGLTD